MYGNDPKCAGTASEYSKFEYWESQLEKKSGLGRSRKNFRGGGAGEREDFDLAQKGIAILMISISFFIISYHYL